MATDPTMHGHHPEPQPQSRMRTSRYAVGFVLLAAIAAWFLLEEHRAHLAGALPFLLLLACPLLHLFMHRGHGGHGDSRRTPSAGGEPR